MSTPVIKYNSFRNKISISPGSTVDKQYLFPYFSKHIEEMLGMTDYDNKSLYQRESKKEFERGWFDAYRPVDLNAGYYSLYLYCNLVRESFVGNTFAQLLREIEIPANAQHGQQIVLTYTHPHYIPLAVNNFQIVYINIKNELNETVPFEFGRVIVKLHFKQYD